MLKLMKGTVWSERKDAKDRKGNPIVTYPLYGEVKYDEIRCHVRVSNIDQQCTQFANVEFLSYAGKPLHNMSYFSDQFVELTARVGYKEFDCGVLVNGNFNDSYRWVRSSRGVPDGLSAKDVQFYLFDLPESTQPYRVRHAERDWVARRVHWLRTPTAILLESEADVDGFYVQAVSAGNEGIMLKQGDGLYERKRTDAWLKMKPENDADGVIVGFVQAVCGVDQPARGLKVGDPLGRVGSVLVRCEDGSEAAPHGIAWELGTDMFKHPEKYLGQWCEFKFMERDRQGGYRHPRFHRLREGK